jgi:hypothetical protein
MHVRFAARKLDRLMVEPDRTHVWADALDAGCAQLVVSPQATFFRPPGTRWVELGHKPQLGRIVNALLDHRRDAETPALAVDDLIEQAWPGESIVYDAAMNRVYKSISLLRKQGFKKTIQRVEDGYRIDPAVAILRVPPRI